MCLASKFKYTPPNKAFGLALILAVCSMSLDAQLPTVNGLFYGDGDDGRYTLLNVDPTGSAQLLYAIDESTTTLYLAGLYVLGDQGYYTASDNAFAPEPKNPYVVAVGWNNRRFDHVTGSDHARFRIRCGGVNGTVYDFNIDLLYNPQADPCDFHQGIWLSDPYGEDGGGTLPPGLQTTSSMAWNLNNTSWDVDQDFSCSYKDWQSPDIDENLTPIDAADMYPNFNTTVGWEWATVYEMSMDYSWCNGQQFEVSIWDLHSSPWKPDWTPPDTPLIAYSNIEALPLYWEKVKAEAAGSGIMVSWSTYQELNVSHFELERSADGVTYEKIGEIPFEDSRTFSNEWEFEDRYPFNGINYYRIKQLDHDGNSDFSPIATAKYQAADARTALYPNPAADIVSLKGVGDGPIVITDQIGRTIAELDVHKHLINGNGEYQLDVSRLQSGIYFISWDNETHRMVKK